MEQRQQSNVAKACLGVKSVLKHAKKNENILSLKLGNTCG
jgi:hypothetical protein